MNIQTEKNAIGMHSMKELVMFVKLQDIRWWHYYKTEKASISSRS